jgi:hypothetical protein
MSKKCSVSDGQIGETQKATREVNGGIDGRLSGSRQSAFVIKKVGMICGSKRFLEVSGTVPADRKQAIREAQTMFLSNPIDSLANRNRHRGRHALPRQLRQFFC